MNREHLFRRHLATEFQCERCFERFPQAEDLRQHRRQDPPCLLGTSAASVEGITPDTERLLRSMSRRPRGRDRMSTEVQQWVVIYRILFPDATEIPNPCENTSPGFK